MRRNREERLFGVRSSTFVSSGLALAVVVSTSIACSGPINVTPAPTDSRLEATVGRPRSGAGLSHETEELLELYGLKGRLPAYPTAVLAVLDGLEGSHLERQALAAVAEVAMMAGGHILETSPDEATGWYLLAAARAYEFMFGGDASVMERALDPRFQRMRRVYNTSVGAYLGLRSQNTGGFRSHVQATRFELFWVEVELGPGRLDPAAQDAMLLSNHLEIRGLRNRYRRQGLGAALVAYRANRQAEPSDRFYPREGFVDPATAVLHFGPRLPDTAGQAHNVELAFYDPRVTDAIRIGPHEVPLEADFTSHYAYLASLSDLPALGRKGLLHPEDYADRQGLVLMEPYDPAKTPVIMVHGLRSSPLAWMELTNDLFGDPELRSRYQIWHYLYPSGLPYLYAGMVFRAKLEALQVELDPDGDDPAMRSIVLIAHSMGGLLTRSLVCDSGMRIWNTVFRVPPEELRGAPQDIEWLKGMLVFSPKPYVARVIFIATPHRGSKAAAGLLGHLSSSLVEMPGYFIERIGRLIADNREFAGPDMQAVLDKAPPNSIRALRPRHPVLKVLSELAIDPRVPYHSIIGNRGREGEEPISDGWVTYDSAHLEGASSELIVPSGHGAYAHPVAIAEIKRILRVHLSESSSGTLGSRQERGH